MDYKSTLNLPQTDFPMKADLVMREPARLKQWETAGLYAAIQAPARRRGAVCPARWPALCQQRRAHRHRPEQDSQDIIVKYKTLRGFSAPYIPGWDCHGLPIEFKVTQDMRKAGEHGFRRGHHPQGVRGPRAQVH